ncbi:lipoyl(octanoyl) transferase LipB [Ferrovibrio sp.]|uniref:lipoyl(octanoyl) transferase LipB n=1 Tax=Ferrovibrio sp. TaxID=1917215 RepID=UPI001B56562E|nr:lipoyl(octanoyl) transferase LipB [Ferrovibrio sp.]MBP7066010.1 lipoyl(octanoyl) transferase LipB [Ferrovibrio sp.]
MDPIIPAQIPAASEILATPAGPIDWAVSDAPVPYLAAVAAMEQRVAAIHAGTAPELIWLLQHPPLYTAGTSAKPGDLLDPRFPVFNTGRGGQYTYHGPGQRIVYLLLDLGKRGRDLRNYVCRLEDWVIHTLASYNVRAERRPGRVGVWVPRPDKAPEGREDKIAAIGVRVRHWVSFHGLSLNVEPDLSHYGGIIPCGIQNNAATPYGVTSLVDLGLPVDLTDTDSALRAHIEASLLNRLVAPSCT